MGLIKNLKEYSKQNKLEDNLKILLYGESGVGKTTFANTFPGKRLLLSTDGRFKHLKDQENIDVAEIQYKDNEIEGKLFDGWELFEMIVGQLVKDNGKKYKTVIVDLLTDIYEMCRIKVLSDMGISDESEASFGKGFKKVDDTFLPTIKTLLNLPNVNVLIVAHEKEIEGKIGPNLSGKVITKLQGYVQLNGRLLATQMPGEERQNKIFFIPSLREKASNIVGITRALDPNWQSLVNEIKMVNSDKKETKIETISVVKGEKNE